MKKIGMFFAVAFAFFLAFSSVKAEAAATSGKCSADGAGNDVSWEVTNSGKTLTISGTGAMKDFGNGEAPWVTDYKDTITKVVISDGVTNVGTKFCGATTTKLSALEEVVIGKDVTKIGDYAFYNCTSLKKLTIGASVEVIGKQAFQNSKLVNVTVPASVTAINVAAFKNVAVKLYLLGDMPTITSGGTTVDASSLKLSILVPTDKLATVQAAVGTSSHLWTAAKDRVLDAYSGSCGTTATWSFDPEAGKLTVSGSGDMDSYQSAAAPWVHLTSEIKKVDISGVNNVAYGFSGTNGYTANVEEIVIGAGVKSVDKLAFYKCSKLTAVTLGADLTSIGEQAFQGCGTLSDIEIPVGLTTFSRSAFKSDTVTLKFAGTTFPTIGETGATADADTIANITLAVLYSSVTDWTTALASSPWNGAKIAEIIPDNMGYCGAGENLKNVMYSFDKENGTLTIEGTGKMADFSSTDEPGYKKFSEDIKKVVFKGIENVGSQINGPSGFAPGIEEIVLDDTVKSIGTLAFYQCRNLKSVKLSSNLETIGAQAFQNCDRMPDVEIPATVTKISRSAFKGTVVNLIFKGTEFPEIEEAGAALDERSSGLGVSNTTVICDEAVLADWTIALANSAWSRARIEKSSDETPVLSGNCGLDASPEDVIYELYESTGTLVIRGKGYSQMKGYTLNNPAPWRDYVGSIKRIIFIGVVNVGSGISGADKSANQVETIEIGDSVTTIGASAFYMCKNITELKLSANLKTIGAQAFQNCCDLAITLPDSMVSIHQTAFKGTNVVMTFKGDTFPELLTTGSVGLGETANANVDKTTIRCNPDVLESWRATLASSVWSRARIVDWNTPVCGDAGTAAVWAALLAVSLLGMAVAVKKRVFA